MEIGHLTQKLDKKPLSRLDRILNRIERILAPFKIFDRTTLDTRFNETKTTLRNLKEQAAIIAVESLQQPKM